jgi:single-strand DNA-binding protein
MSTNIWAFSGNLGRDAELKSTPNGHTLLEFNVAVTSGWGDRKQTTWVRCELWNKRAEALHPHLPKGQRVIVSGEATNREYEKKDGTKGRSLELRVSEIEIIGDRQSPPKREPEQQEPGFRESAKAQTSEFTDDDIPF